MTSPQKYVTRKAVKAGTRWTARHVVFRTADRMKPGRRVGGVPGTVAYVAAGMTLGAALAWLLDPRRRGARKQAAQQATAAARHGMADAQAQAAHAAQQAKATAAKASAPARDALTEQPDDVTLARKVETEIFRAADAPKGDVVVNAVNGVIELRGQVDSTDMIARLVREAEAVGGVRAVQSLLHTPDSPAPMSEGGSRSAGGRRSS